MGGAHGCRHPGVAAVDSHGCETRCLRHSGAGAVQAEKRHTGIPYGKTGTDALVEQVAAEQRVQVRVLQTRLPLGGLQGNGLHFALRFFPGELTEGGVRGGAVEVGGQRPLAFLFAADGTGGQNGGAAVKDNALPAPV